jgi:hypothetical protein
MYKNATKCNETIGKWCKNKHGASKIIDTFETYQRHGAYGGGYLRVGLRLRARGRRKVGKRLVKLGLEEATRETAARRLRKQFFFTPCADPADSFYSHLVWCLEVQVSNKPTYPAHHVSLPTAWRSRSERLALAPGHQHDRSHRSSGRARAAGAWAWAIGLLPNRSWCQGSTLDRASGHAAESAQARRGPGAWPSRPGERPAQPADER